MFLSLFCLAGEERIVAVITLLSFWNEFLPDKHKTFFLSITNTRNNYVTLGDFAEFYRLINVVKTFQEAWQVCDPFFFEGGGGVSLSLSSVPSPPHAIKLELPVWQNSASEEERGKRPPKPPAFLGHEEEGALKALGKKKEEFSTIKWEFSLWPGKSLNCCNFCQFSIAQFNFFCSLKIMNLNELLFSWELARPECLTTFFQIDQIYAGKNLLIVMLLSSHYTINCCYTGNSSEKEEGPKLAHNWIYEKVSK